jgi:hypothetical protein
MDKNWTAVRLKTAQEGSCRADPSYFDYNFKLSTQDVDDGFDRTLQLVKRCLKSINRVCLSHTDLFPPSGFSSGCFLHDPRIKVLGTRGHMVRPRRGPSQSNPRANRMEFKNLRRQGGVLPTIKEAAIASRRQEATDNIPRQDHSERELRNSTGTRTQQKA